MFSKVPPPPKKNLTVHEIMRMIPWTRTGHRWQYGAYTLHAPNTHSEYVRVIACHLRLWLLECASVVRYTYVACLVYFYHFDYRHTDRGINCHQLLRLYSAGCRRMKWEYGAPVEWIWQIISNHLGKPFAHWHIFRTKLHIHLPGIEPGPLPMLRHSHFNETYNL